jgi:hypothetical protein
MLLADVKPPAPNPYSPSQPDFDLMGAALRMARLYYDRYSWILDWSNVQGKTALHIAALKGNEELVRVRRLIAFPILSCHLSLYRCCVTLELIMICLTIKAIRHCISECFLLPEAARTDSSLAQVLGVISQYVFPCMFTRQPTNDSIDCTTSHRTRVSILGPQQPWLYRF